MTDQQQIEKAAQIMHDMNGCADPYGTCISTSEYYREMAQALADAGMLNPDLGVALESARHNADMWYRNRNLWQKRAEKAEAERDALAATLQRVRELADNYERRGTTHHHVVVALRAILDDKGAAE